MTIQIKQVLDVFGIYYPQNNIFNIKCPFCDDKKKHLNINVSNNVWKCSRCDEGGGSLHLYSKMSRIKDLYNARVSLLKILKDKGAFIPEETMVKTEDKISYEIKKPTPYALNKVYTALLKELTLSEKDMLSLQKRGLTERYIKSLNYRSVDGCCNFDIPITLFNKDIYVRDIPGFAYINGRWAFCPPFAGILIPFRDIKGNIIGLQVRATDATKNKKYIWLSTKWLQDYGKAEIGYKACTTAHIVGWYNGAKSVCLTEGALKGDIAYYLAKNLLASDNPFLCIAGVSSHKNFSDALMVLKEKGVDTIYNCLDMDRMELNPLYNKFVGASCAKLKKIAKDMGFSWKEKYWDYSLKGIDDYLFDITTKKEQKKGA